MVGGTAAIPSTPIRIICECVHVENVCVYAYMWCVCGYVCVCVCVNCCLIAASVSTDYTMQ